MAPTTRNRAAKRKAHAAATPEITHSKKRKAREATPVTNEQPKAEDTPADVPPNGISKPTAAKSKGSNKRPLHTLKAKLVKKLDAEDQEQLAHHQAQLLRRASIALAGEGLGLPVVLDAAANIDVLPQTTNVPATSRNKSGRRGRPKKACVDEGEIFDFDEHDKLGLSGRHIPQIGLRRRVCKKPAKVAFSIWMAYSQLDDFIYRNSLAEDEVLALPTDDQVFDFHNGGEAPSLPPDLAWDDKKRPIDQRYLEQHAI
ncbi:hypothetical protein Daus18300_006156 [Diaporthe australafricana]|uniref:Uncharacterized protein n=1 Tax=Diaporthe australafricana TaxID=127596 RepID=A0ABR3WWR2_9PEZI